MAAIDADFSKTFLFPPALEDFLPADHPGRFVRELVECVLPNLELEWKKEDGEGRPPFASALLLRVWIYGYLHRITTVRKLEAACREHVGLLWLTGMNAPDHNTLWRFWKMNRKTVKQVFRQAMRLAVDAGMIGMALHAIDGTKIQSRSSTRTAWSRRKLEKFLKRVDEQIATLEASIASHLEGDDEGYRLQQDLKDQKTLRKTITERLDKLTSANATDMNPNEPEARLMKSGVGIRLGYNAQMVADAANGMIVAETVSNEPFDQGQMMPIMDLVEAEFGATALETIADGGYNTEQTLVEAEAKGRSITVAPGANEAESHSDDPYHASRFKYEPIHNVFVCPQNQQLAFEERKKKSNKRTVDVYRCSVSATCPVASQCTNSRRGRTIERSQHFEIVARQRVKRDSDEGRANMKLRSQLAERPFADIKRHLGFVRFRGAGLLNAAAEWTWICLTFNLRVMLRRWRLETASSA